MHIAARTQDWVAYLTTMEHLKEAIGLQGYAQKDPLVEYKNEAFLTFEQLKRDIQFEIATTIFRVQVTHDPPPQAGQSQGRRRGSLPVGATGVQWLHRRDRHCLQLLEASVSAGGGRGRGRSCGTGSPVEPPSANGGEPGRAGRPAASVATGPRKVGRNDPCPCGSGRKYKRCHGR